MKFTFAPLNEGVETADSRENWLRDEALDTVDVSGVARLPSDGKQIQDRTKACKTPTEGSNPSVGSRQRQSIPAVNPAENRRFRSLHGHDLGGNGNRWNGGD